MSIIYPRQFLGTVPAARSPSYSVALHDAIVTGSTFVTDLFVASHQVLRIVDFFKVVEVNGEKLGGMST